MEDGRVMTAGGVLFFVGGAGDAFVRARRAGVDIPAVGSDISAGVDIPAAASDTPVVECDIPAAGGIPADDGVFFYWCVNVGGDVAALAKLLRAKAVDVDSLDDDCALILPHPGRISAWGAKAADIVCRCGFGDASTEGAKHGALLRVERGLLLRGDHAKALAHQLADKMTESVFCRADMVDNASVIFCRPPPQNDADMQQQNPQTNAAVDDLLGRAATEAESLMFEQVNSEHCRHHIFNSKSGGGDSMMTMIRQTHKESPRGAINVFADNAAVVEGCGGGDFFADETDGIYRAAAGYQYLVAKAETHNHPTAVSPFFGAATGSGGELRDEAAAGTGAMARAGFCGFAVSMLPFAHCPPSALPAAPPRFADALRIMIEAPLGAAAYNNEFGRPAIGGFFRVYESAGAANDKNDKHNKAAAYHFGFHKPLMLAGGLGHILPSSAHKKQLRAGDLIIHLGGAGLRVGMGGGAASSDSGGMRSADADFNSVQRGNAEMQRRAMEVIDTLRRRDNDNNGGGALAVHDVGAGGLGCAVAELAHNAGFGALVRLAAIPVEEDEMRPAEIWCNEAQERFVLALSPSVLDSFAALCARERCPFAVIGEITNAPALVVIDGDGKRVVDFPLDKLLGGERKVLTDTPPPKPARPPKLRMQTNDDLRAACYALLHHPSVGSKRFLITIGDRTVGGLTARDQMIGPWQTPVADCAAFMDNFSGYSGACFAIGERPGIAAMDVKSGARMAIAESMCNLAAADIGDSPIHLSLNWLADCSTDSGGLRAAVAAAADFCIGIGVGVVVGKDSLSMKMPAGDAFVGSPPMAVATAFSAMADARRVLTPQLQTKQGEGMIMRLFPDDDNHNNLGGSVFASLGGGDTDDDVADISAAAMRRFLAAIKLCKNENLFSAFHDCSDGGMWAAVCEMAFAANCGLLLTADSFGAEVGDTDGDELLAARGGLAGLARVLFGEGIAVLAEVSKENTARVLQIFAERKMAKCAQTIGASQSAKRIQICMGGKVVIDESTADLRRAWQKTDTEICMRRDNPQCAAEESQRDYDNDPGLFLRAPKDWQADIATTITTKQKPRVAILREQGINGHREMAAAFVCAGFDAVDVHISDLQSGRRKLDDFCGAAFCGGFSFGDVLGAGRGYAGALLGDKKLSLMFASFFKREDTFVLGVCNGCQTLSHLRAILPDGDNWQFPHFMPNKSGVFEARLTMAEVLPNNSPLFAGMAGMMLPVVSSHAEGRAVFDDDNNGKNNNRNKNNNNKSGNNNNDNNGGGVIHSPALMRYVDNTGKASEQYPHNPNGSPGGLCGFTSPDGTIAALMPHPERIYRTAQMSYPPPDWQNTHTPWLQIFTNARKFVTGG